MIYTYIYHLNTFQGYEERVYLSKKWICTKLEGPEYDPLISPLFRKLFNYISGKNEPSKFLLNHYYGQSFD